MISIRFVLQLKGFHQGNYNGEFVCAFASNLGVCLIVKVELWAILIAIILALSRGFSKLSIECGSATAINMINSGVCVHHLCYTLYAVASHGMSIDTGIKLLDSIPDFIYLLLLADASAATWYCRSSLHYIKNIQTSRSGGSVFLGTKNDLIMICRYLFYLGKTRTIQLEKLPDEEAEQFLTYPFIDPEPEKPWLAQRRALRISYSA
ncbi:hypothetical protein D0Y65_049641 [Glycine soja]|uniref:RNase H type-1 domain-containing protein n=1 Tax=Glycine soja TaxID=3848 RepID=A0A445FXY1_GLYSO|nr:hypothetical protein D0Y65_049641 [Glycine soja]